MNNQIMNVTPPMQTINSALPGKVISVSCNVIMALSLLEGYLDSTYALQTADTKLEAAISNQETAIVDAFEAYQNGPNGYLHQLEKLTPKNDKKHYSTDVAKLSAEYAAASAENQARTKMMDANNSVAQNALNQNAQGQPGVVQIMGDINSIAQNLAQITARVS